MDYEFADNPHLARNARWAPNITDRLPPGLGFENSPHAVLFYPTNNNDNDSDATNTTGTTNTTSTANNHNNHMWGMQPMMWTAVYHTPMTGPTRATGCHTAADPSNSLLPRAERDHHKEPIPSQHRSRYDDAAEHGHLTGAWRRTQPDPVYRSRAMTDEEFRALTTSPLNQPQQVTDEDRRIVTHADGRTRDMVKALGIDYIVGSDQLPDPTGALSRPPPSIYGPGLVRADKDVELPRVKSASPWTMSSDEGLKKRFRDHLRATANAKRQDFEIEEETKEEDKEYHLHGADPRAGRNEPSVRKTQHLRSTWTIPRAEAAGQDREEEDRQRDGENSIQGNGLLASFYAEMAARRAENRGNVHTRGLLARTQDVPSWNRANINVCRRRLLGVTRNGPEADAAARPNRFPRLEASEHVSPETLRFSQRYDPRGSGVRPDNGGGSQGQPPLEPESHGEELDGSGEGERVGREDGESPGREDGEGPGEEVRSVVESSFWTFTRRHH